ncbi:hypothetical protein MVEN_00844300 [Mycena venus]|uniref:DUF6533 domain-containing protein n=1 Tax=Mycena venus TaxID=2733690 RepID=A0A8H6YBG6_9AGAR|nr:hypothetical protein MVEN_00844300 [Mycena venus]
MSEDAFISEFLHVVNVAQTYIACTTAILVWDWLSCLPQEWRTIWKSEAGWSPIKVLYCLVRYYTLVVLVVTDVWFFANWSESSCARYVRILPGIAVLIDLSVELVLAVRVYALYGSSKKMGVFLIVLIAGFLGVMIAVPILAFDYTKLPSWPGPCIGMCNLIRYGLHNLTRLKVTGKASIAGPKFIIAFYASPMAFDIIMTALTVYKSGTGFFYFFAITSLNLLNVIFFIQRNELIQAINAPMSIQISSVLCCRLILNLRTANEAKNNAKRFSNTRGGWITDIVQDSEDQGTIQFTARSYSRPLSPRTPPSEFPSPTQDGDWRI